MYVHHAIVLKHGRAFVGFWPCCKLFKGVVENYHNILQSLTKAIEHFLLLSYLLCREPFRLMLTHLHTFSFVN